MRQVIFRIPIHIPDWCPDGIPIYGYGLMLFFAFVACTWLAARRARKEGIRPELIQDLAIWLFVGGIIGSRIVFMIQYRQPIERFFFIWEGGLVFYGGLIGGAIAYALAYYFLIRKQGVPGWKLADIVAPSLALGLCLGRVGCLLNGCCYGHVACPDCPQMHFFLSSMPRFQLVARGYQTAAGFTMDDTAKDDRTVGAVEEGSPAAESGLAPGDVIVKADDLDIANYDALWDYLTNHWPRGKNDLALTVRRDGREIALPAFTPRTLGLHPTQLYESISAFLLFLLLSAFYLLRRGDGEVIALFLLLYPIHRFLNEMLRNDTDPLADGLTLSQNGSIVVFVAAVFLSLWLFRRRLAADDMRPTAPSGKEILPSMNN